MIFETKDRRLVESIHKRSKNQTFCDEITDFVFDNTVWLTDGERLFPCHIWCSKSLCNIHAVIPTDKRGVDAVKRAKEAVEYMEEKGLNVYSTIVKQNKSARHFARQVGLHRIDGEFDSFILYVRC